MQRKSSFVALQKDPIHFLRAVVQADSEWIRKFDDISRGKRQVSVHIAIFQEPYLTYILDGRKTVESRFSINKCAPYRLVNEGDIVLFKKASGPIVAAGEVSSAAFYELHPKMLRDLERQFSAALCAEHDPDFWVKRSNRAFATLITFENIVKTAPTLIDKKDRRGWVLVKRVRTTSAIAVAGAIGSGKTTVTAALSAETGLPTVSFGDIIRRKLGDQGKTISRKALQQLGATLVEDDARSLCEELLAQVPGFRNTGVIIEGLRHTRIYRSLLRGVNPLKLYLVFLEPKSIEVPMLKFDTVDPDSIRRIQRHSTERELSALRKMADVLIPADWSLKRSVQHIVRELGLKEGADGRIMQSRIGEEN